MDAGPHWRAVGPGHEVCAVVCVRAGYTTVRTVTDMQTLEAGVSSLPLRESLIDTT